jgi:hypothetical protein
MVAVARFRRLWVRLFSPFETRFDGDHVVGPSPSGAEAS